MTFSRTNSVALLQVVAKPLPRTSMSSIGEHSNDRKSAAKVFTGSIIASNALEKTLNVLQINATA
jgi:hypothetical protein